MLIAYLLTVCADVLTVRDDVLNVPADVLTGQEGPGGGARERLSDSVQEACSADLLIFGLLTEIAEVLTS